MKFYLVVASACILRIALSFSIQFNRMKEIFAKDLEPTLEMMFCTKNTPTIVSASLSRATLESTVLFAQVSSQDFVVKRRKPVS